MVFEHLQPAADNLFYSRGDALDPRFGDVVRRGDDAYAEARVVVVGCPQDEGVRRCRGRIGATHGPTEIRRALYRFPVSEAHASLRLFDAGDVRIAPTLERTHDLLAAAVERILADGKIAVVLGGGNDISYPDGVALSRVAARPLVFNIDRHLDVRADQPRNSGTSYRLLLEEGAVAPARFHEVGTNSYANSVAYRNYVRETGATIHYLDELRSGGVGATVGSIVAGSDADAVFYGFDMDVVRACEAPGVSDPSPMGLTAREVCEIADVAAGDPRTRLIEITEVNPLHDINGITARLAANIILRALARPVKE